MKERLDQAGDHVRGGRRWDDRDPGTHGRPRHQVGPGSRRLVRLVNWLPLASPILLTVGLVYATVQARALPSSCLRGRAAGQAAEA